MMLYVRDLEKAKHNEGGIPDRQRLTEARNDLDKVLTVRPCLRTHLGLAQVRLQANNKPCEQILHSNRVFRSTTLCLGVLLHGCGCATGEPLGG